MAGGYLDQPFTLMQDLEAVRRARDIVLAQKQDTVQATGGGGDQVYKDLAARAMAMAKGG